MGKEEPLGGNDDAIAPLAETDPVRTTLGGGADRTTDRAGTKETPSELCSTEKATIGAPPSSFGAENLRTTRDGLEETPPGGAGGASNDVLLPSKKSAEA